MRIASTLVPTLSHYFTITHNHTTHHWVRTRRVSTTLSQTQGPFHVTVIIRGKCAHRSASLSRGITILDKQGNRSLIKDKTS
jgi:hypothetical protein